MELWRSAGFALETVQASDINPVAGSSNPELVTSINSMLIFAANNGTSGPELRALSNPTPLPMPLAMAAGGYSLSLPGGLKGFPAAPSSFPVDELIQRAGWRAEMRVLQREGTSIEARLADQETALLAEGGSADKPACGPRAVVR